MCVILTVDTDDARPTEEELMAAWHANPHGAGIAWVEGNAVQYEKVGPDPKAVGRIIDLALKVPAPFVVHFRITSSGETRPELSHPFPVRLKKPLALKGTTGAALFHNGTWTGWRQFVLAAASSTGEPLGDGPMSDTRGMAYLAAVLGRGILETMPVEQKIALLTLDGAERFGKGWVEVREGLWASNNYWYPKVATEGAAMGLKDWVRSLNPNPAKGNGKTYAKSYLTKDEVAAVNDKPRLVKGAKR